MQGMVLGLPVVQDAGLPVVRDAGPALGMGLAQSRRVETVSPDEMEQRGRTSLNLKQNWPKFRGGTASSN